MKKFDKGYWNLDELRMGEWFEENKIPSYQAIDVIHMNCIVKEDLYKIADKHHMGLIHVDKVVEVLDRRLGV